MEIGIDIGGTFTDIVCRIGDGSVRYRKIADHAGRLSRAVLSPSTSRATNGASRHRRSAVSCKAPPWPPTRCCNAKGARIGLIITEGFRDVLEIGRQMRHQMYDLALRAETPVFLARRRYRMEVRERLDAQGNVLIPLDQDSVQRAVGDLVTANVQAITVCLLFSFPDPMHGRCIRDVISAQYPALAVSLSSDVDPDSREYERTFVSAFDA